MSQMERIQGKRKMGESSAPTIAYPSQPLVGSGSTPIIEIPDTPERPQFYTAEEFEERKNKIA